MENNKGGSMKNKLLTLLVLICMSLVFVIDGVRVADSVISGETLINVQDSTASIISTRRVKDAGNAADGLSSGLMGVGCFVYNGTTWDRCRGDATNGVKVQVTTMPTVTAAISNTTIGTKTTQGTTITANQVTITNVSSMIATTNTARYSLSTRNIGTVTMYIGPVTVTTSTGYPLAANEGFTFDRNTGAIYGITSSGSTTAAYLEE